MTLAFDGVRHSVIAANRRNNATVWRTLLKDKTIAFKDAANLNAFSGLSHVFSTIPEIAKSSI